MKAIQIRAERETGGVEILTRDGYPIHGIRKAVVTMEVGQLVRAELEMVSTFSGDATAVFMVIDPEVNVFKPVRKMEFADGTSWSAE